jgi:hypothetical protein
MANRQFGTFWLIGMTKPLTRDEARPHCGQYRQAAGTVAEAVIRSVELIVQPDTKDAVGVVALGPAKRIITENSLPLPTSSGRTER